jgi:UDP-N-acetylglucosamine 2-epimerase
MYSILCNRLKAVKLMVMKKKVMCVFGTRPEAVKMAPVIHALRDSKHLEPIVVSTAQHREMLDQMIEWFQIQPEHDLDIMRHGQSLAELTARVLTGIDQLLTKCQPDLLLVQGDTLTVMAAALAAFYHKVPVGHVEAGLRTTDRYNPFPEEMSRRQTGRIATLHFAPTPKAVENLRREGVTEHVYMTGNTVIDALEETVTRLGKAPLAAKLINELFGQVNFDQNRVLLVTAHRRENWGEPMKNIASALKQIADEFPDVQILYPIHRNPIVRESVEPVFNGHAQLKLIEPLDYVPLVYAMQRCFFVLTDSGGIQEEAPTLGKPVLVLRTNTERPESVEAGTAKLVGVSQEGIVSAARRLLTEEWVYNKMASAINPFGDGHAAERIVYEIERFLATTGH